MSNIHLCRNVTAAEINNTTYNANTIGALLAAYRSTIMHSPKVQNMESEAVCGLIQRDLQKGDKAYALITPNKLRPNQLDSFIEVLKTLILSCMKKNKWVELCRVLYKEENETGCETVIGQGDDRRPPAVHSVPPDSIPGELQPTNNTAVESLGYTQVPLYVPEVADVTPPLELPQPDGDEHSSQFVEADKNPTDSDALLEDGVEEQPSLLEDGVEEQPSLLEDGVEEQPSLEGSNTRQALLEDGVEDQPSLEGSNTRQHIGIQTKLPIADEGECKGCSAGKELVEFCYTHRLDYCNVNMLKLLLHACFTNSSSEGPNCKKCEKVLELVHNIEEMQLKGIQDDALYEVAKKAKKIIRASMKKSTKATVQKRKYIRKNKCPSKKTPKHDKKTLGPVASMYGRFAEVDDEGVNNEWRTKMSSCIFDVGCTSWLRLEHNKARLSSWIIPMRCVSGAFKSTQLQFPKYTYQGSLWVEDISNEEKVSIAMGEAPNEIIGKGIFYNILARSLFPADSCGAILKYGTYSGTSSAKKNRSTSAGSSDEEDVQNKELQESPFVNFRFDCMFSLSPDGKRSPFVPGLMRSILTDEVRKLKNLRDKKLMEVMKDIKKDASSFSTKPNIGIVTFKKWIKTCYEKQMRTIIGNYMQEMDCVSEEFQSFRPLNKLVGFMALMEEVWNKFPTRKETNPDGKLKDIGLLRLEKTGAQQNHPYAETGGSAGDHPFFFYPVPVSQNGWPLPAYDGSLTGGNMELKSMTASGGSGMMRVKRDKQRIADKEIQGRNNYGA
ncbi:unnamed protein product, partial [Notodromas monacha]